MGSLARFELWLKGLIAAVVTGGSGGILTGFAAIGVEPSHFNLAQGLHSTLKIAGAAATINAIIGAAAYLQKSPVPQDREVWTDEQRAAAKQPPPEQKP